MGTQISASLFWLVNGSTVATYGFKVTDVFPLPLSVNPPLDGATAEIISASNTSDDRKIDIISVLVVSDVSILNGDSLHCAEAVVEASI